MFKLNVSLIKKCVSVNSLQLHKHIIHFRFNLVVRKKVRNQKGILIILRSIYIKTWLLRHVCALNCKNHRDCNLHNYKSNNSW